MKKSVICLLLVLNFCFLSFATELKGKDLQAVNRMLDAKLYVNDYKEIDDKLNYLNQVKKQIDEIMPELSEEAALLCSTGLYMQIELLKAAKENSDLGLDQTYLAENEKNQKKKKEDKELKKAKEEEAKAFIMGLKKQFDDFKDTHKNLSSHFYFHYKEIEFATMPFLQLNEQLKILKTVLDDYKEIYEMNPDYGENLVYYGMILYMAPKVAGGDKTEGLEKIQRATKKSATSYEKSSAFVLYSQILFEDKNKEEARKYLNEAEKIDPANLTIQDIKKMNDAGFSMFNVQDYAKYEKKN